MDLHETLEKHLAYTKVLFSEGQEFSVHGGRVEWRVTMTRIDLPPTNGGRIYLIREVAGPDWDWDGDYERTEVIRAHSDADATRIAIIRADNMMNTAQEMKKRINDDATM